MGVPIVMNLFGGKKSGGKGIAGAAGDATPLTRRGRKKWVEYLKGAALVTAGNAGGAMSRYGLEGSVNKLMGVVQSAGGLTMKDGSEVTRGRGILREAILLLGPALVAQIVIAMLPMKRGKGLMTLGVFLDVLRRAIQLGVKDRWQPEKPWQQQLKAATVGSYLYAPAARPRIGTVPVREVPVGAFAPGDHGEDFSPNFSSRAKLLAGVAPEFDAPPFHGGGALGAVHSHHDLASIGAWAG